jgi:spore photoproduct lyase
MTVQENFLLTEKVETCLVRCLPIKLGVNKRSELVRLVYEISLSRGVRPEEVISAAGIPAMAEEGRNGLFHRVKTSLLKTRYPSMKKGDDPHLKPLKIPDRDNILTEWDNELKPRRVFIEKSALRLKWTEELLGKIPSVPVEEIDDITSFIKSPPAREIARDYDSRREYLLITRKKNAFVKICPCTKGARRCGYWILDLGFGCPIDCSYCYLQVYSNIPGIVLTANVEDCYDEIRAFDDRSPGRTRIGTGEFTDSLALDRYSGYSKALIPVFKHTRNLVLELKTKASDIDNVLQTEPNNNVVVSWSINTRKMAERYEKGASTVTERMNAACLAARRGYRTGFHFDPIMLYEGWEDEYREIVTELFSREEIRKNTAWVSIGTLRYTPGLKQAAEQRFDDNRVFYEGEFFAGYDGKLRYPKHVRDEIYRKMTEWIVSSGTEAWVYPCMEPPDVWERTRGGQKCRKNIF